MKKLIAILAILFTMTVVTACDWKNGTSFLGTTPENEIEQETNDDKKQDNRDENKSVNDSQSGDTVKPITGGGDFNVGKDYNK